jgi:transposase
MEKLDLQTRISLVRLYYENGSSAAAALRKFKTLNNLVKDPFCVTTVQRLLHKFETEGIVIDSPKSGRPPFGEEVVERVEQTLLEGQASSSQRIFSAHQITRETGIPNIYKLLG